METCPLCKGKLIIRTNCSTQEKFYGCSEYPKCRYTAGMNKATGKPEPYEPSWEEHYGDTYD